MYFEFTSPYYALVRAHSGREACGTFAEVVCPADEENGEQYEYKVLTNAEALATYALSSREVEYKGTLIQQRQSLQKDFADHEYDSVLIVDADLV